MTRARSRKATKIKNVDTSYYIGYCEDEETPEAIMQKFAALERMQTKHQKEKLQEQGLDSDGEEKEPVAELPEKYLKQLFEETTMFAVDDIIEAEPQLVEKYHIDEYGFWDLSGDSVMEDSEWSENSSDLRSEKQGKHSIRKSDAKRTRKKLFVSDPPHRFRSHRFARRRVRKFKEIRYQVCPRLPLVPSYCHMIMPYKDPVPAVFPEADIFHDELIPLLKGNKVYGIYLNLPWVHYNPDDEQNQELWRGFREIQYPDKLIELGLLFVYLPTVFFVEAVEVMKIKGFKWVESAIVITRDFGKVVLNKSKNRLLHAGKQVLHIFRKLNKGDLPMQHQRTTNAHLLNGEDKMHYTYNLIETMLPPNLDGQKNVRLLELYNIGERREGWIQIGHRD